MIYLQETKIYSLSYCITSCYVMLSYIIISHHQPLVEQKVLFASIHPCFSNIKFRVLISHFTATWRCKQTKQKMISNFKIDFQDEMEKDGIKQKFSIKEGIEIVGGWLDGWVDGWVGGCISC